MLTAHDIQTLNQLHADRTARLASRRSARLPRAARTARIAEPGAVRLGPLATC